MKGAGKAALIIILLGIAFIWINSEIAYSRRAEKNEEHRLCASDAYGYYQYLPSVFIKHDPLHQYFAMKLDNGYTFNKYTCGVAMMEAPFFIYAHIITQTVGRYEHGGWGPVYMRLLCISAAFYAYLGLWVLFNLLRRKFDMRTAMFSVALIYFATNLYYYTVKEPGMSHVYSFFCFAICMHAIDRYYRMKQRKHLILFGFFFGLAVLIRPTNVLLLLLFLFYDVYTLSQLKERISFHVKNYFNFIIIAALGILVSIPQMIYWYKTTGSPIVFSYGYYDESFINWKDPYLLQVMIGIKSGWLLYSPVMIISVIGLFICLRKKASSAPVIIIMFCILWYACASWWAPTFGCAFGYRSFIEYYPVLALPFAFVIQKILNKAGWRRITIVTSLSVLLIFMNLKLINSYVESGACWDGPDFHWNNFKLMMEDAWRRPLFEAL
jgi:hypothetical protein